MLLVSTLFSSFVRVTDQLGRSISQDPSPLHLLPCQLWLFVCYVAFMQSHGTSESQVRWVKFSTLAYRLQLRPFQPCQLCCCSPSCHSYWRLAWSSGGCLLQPICTAQVCPTACASVHGNSSVHCVLWAGHELLPFALRAIHSLQDSLQAAEDPISAAVLISQAMHEGSY